MTVGSGLLATALLVLVGLYVFRPMFVLSAHNQAITPKEALLAEKDALIVEIKTLDFDYETGKLPDDYYAIQRDKLKLAAAEALRQVDQLPEQISDTEAQIEAAIAAIRAGDSRLQCSHCNHAVVDGDRFCRECGGAL